MSEAFIQRAKEIEARYPTLDLGGFNFREPERDTRWNYARIEKICEFIRNNYKPRAHSSTINYGSYGLKHEIERTEWTEERDKYVTNGEGILALCIEGYTPFNIDNRSPNCNFKVITDYYEKEGKKTAKMLWRNVKHSGQWRKAQHDEAELKKSDQWKSATFRYGYTEEKKLYRNLEYLCFGCMPHKDFNCSHVVCKSKHNIGIIPFEERQVVPV